MVGSQNSHKITLLDIAKSFILAFALYYLVWFILLREYGISAFFDYSAWFWYLILPSFLLYTFLRADLNTKIAASTSPEHITKLQNSIPPFFKVNFILFVIFLVYNFLWLGIYLPLCLYNKWGGVYGCLGWRFDLYFSVLLMFLFSIFGQIYFTKNKKYFSLILYLVAFIYAFMNSFKLSGIADIIFVLPLIAVSDLITYIVISMKNK